MATKDQRTINGVRLYTSSIPVLEASVVWLRVTRFLAPLAVGVRGLQPAELVRLLTMFDKVQDLTTEQVLYAAGLHAPQISEALAKTSPEDLIRLVAGLLQNTTAVSVEGQKIELSRGHDAINEAFDDDIGAMFQAAVWAGVHNFRNFRFGRRGNVANDSSPAADGSTSKT